MNLQTLTLLAALTVPAAALAGAPVETRAYYSTNPGNAVGQHATINIDGEFDDWSESMIIATCGANDIATAFKGSHENCVLDCYALYAAWDDANLYMGWQMCNTTDTWAREGDGPLSDGGRVLDVPLVLALSVNPAGRYISGKLDNGNFIWSTTTGNGVDFSGVHADHLFFMSGKPGLGKPAMFKPVNDKGATNYGAGTTTFRSAGISYKMKEGFQPSHLWRQNTTAQWSTPTTLVSDPSVVDNIYDPACYDNLLAGTPSGLKAHNTSYDSFYEIKIPLSVLGITREWLEANGIGARLVATRGESGIDCVPFDPAMADNMLGEYGKDPSTTHEKDDIDLITYAMADVAKIRDLSNIDPLPETPGGGEEEPTPMDPTPSTSVYTVYFTTTSSWANPYIYIWDAGNSNKQYAGNWPGTKLEQKATFDGQTYWAYTCDFGSVPVTPMVIFNNGQNGPQTENLTMVNNGIYDQSGLTSVRQSGLTAIEAEASVAGEPEFFTLQGVRVAGTPGRGLYLRRMGGKVEKIQVF